MISPTVRSLRAAFELVTRPRHVDVPRTEETFRFHVGRWERLTCNPAPGEIGPETFDAFRTRAKKTGLKHTSIEATVRHVLAILSDLHEAGKLHAVPRSGTKLKIPPPSPVVPAVELFGRLFAHVGAARFPWPVRPFWRAFFALAYFTGLRLADLRRLTRADVDSGVIRFEAGKTGKTLEMPLHPVARRIVSELGPIAGPRYRRGKSRELLFPIGLKQHYEQLDLINAAAGTSKIGAQQIRRLCAEQFELAHAGAGSLILQHSIPGASRFYLRPAVILSRAVERLEIPAEMLTDEERAARVNETTKLQSAWEHLDPQGRETVLRVAEGMRR